MLRQQKQETLSTLPRESLGSDALSNTSTQTPIKRRGKSRHPTEQSPGRNHHRMTRNRIDGSQR
jgi:hypothetical protein